MTYDFQSDNGKALVRNSRPGFARETRCRADSRFAVHDLRHNTIIEMAEAGGSDAMLMAVAGHMSRRMLER